MLDYRILEGCKKRYPPAVPAASLLNEDIGFCNDYRRGFERPAIFGNRDNCIDETFVKRICKNCRDCSTALFTRDVKCCFCCQKFEIFPECFCRLIADPGTDCITCPAVDIVGCLFAVPVALWDELTISPSSKDRASAGQTATHAPHPEHFPVSQTSLFKSR